MKWFVVVPGALLPAAAASALLADAPDRGIEAAATRLARARRHDDETFDPAGDDDAALSASDTAALAWTWRAFGGAGAPVAAPYAWQALTGAPPSRQTWFCDPVHFAVARDHIVLMTLGDAAPDADEAAALIDAAGDALGRAGATVQVAPGGRWFLQFDRPWQLDTTALAEASGRSAIEGMPTGPDAARWRRLLTDIQIEWHEHPVNARREQRGLPPVNGLWVHGAASGAATAPALRRAWGAVASDEPVVRGWALAAGLDPAQVRPIGASFDATLDAAADATHAASPPAPLDAPRDVLLFDTTLRDAASRGDHVAWRAALSALLERLDARLARPGAPASIELLLAGRHAVRRYTLRPHDRWRLWRRGEPAALLGAPSVADAPTHAPA